MASTASTLLLLELQADGENENTWGQKANTQFVLLENAIAKRQAVTLSSTDVTLSDTQFADSQARSLCLALTGTLSADVNVVVPSRSKMYLVTNGTSGAFTVTIKTSGSGVVVLQGTTTAVYCDGTDVVAVQASVSGTVAEATNALQLGGVVAANYARIDAYNQHTKGFGTSFVTLVDGGTVTLNATLSNAFIVTLAGNRTLDITNPADGQSIELWVVQDGTGSRTLAWPASVLFEGGLTPPLSTAPGSINRFFLTYNTALTTWIATDGAIVGSSTSTLNLSASSNTQDVDLYTLAGQPGGAVTVNFTVQTGVIITASSSQNPAVECRGFAAGSTINIVNNGYILGRGGDGGVGGFWRSLTDNQELFFGGTAGKPGGPAIVGPGASRTLNIINANGRIWGGGGGGGGGGATANEDNSARPVSGGGGGGAGGGHGGYGGRSGGSNSGGIDAEADPGEDGSTGRLGVNGGGGAGDEAGAAAGGDGGDGGDWGTAGDAGESPTGNAQDYAGGAGGAAGAAIKPNGGSANIISGSGSPNIKGSTT